MLACARALIGPALLGEVCRARATEPKGADPQKGHVNAWKGPRLFGGAWKTEWCKVRARRSLDAEQADHRAYVLEEGPLGYVRKRDAVRAARNDPQAPAPSLAEWLGVDPSIAKVPARKGLKAKSRASLRGNVQDLLHAPNRTRGKAIVASNHCGFGRLDECASAIVRDSRDKRGERTNHLGERLAALPQRPLIGTVEVSRFDTTVRSNFSGNRPSYDAREKSNDAIERSQASDRAAERDRAMPGERFTSLRIEGIIAARSTLRSMAADTAAMVANAAR